jgi:hypothetical protein
MKAALLALGFVAALSPAVTLAAPRNDKAPTAAKDSKRLTDLQIKRILIKESIANYSGNCPCPYNTASNGSQCGGRSAWSRAGGEEPLCYPKDVTAEMVQVYRDDHPSD